MGRQCPGSRTRASSSVSIAVEGTLRAIGIASKAGTQGVTLVLIETDGAQRIRRLESRHMFGTVRSRPTPADRARALADIVLQFMGNLVLQPFAVDVIGLSDHASRWCDDRVLAEATGVAVLMPCDLYDVPDRECAAATAAYLACCNMRLRERAAKGC
jgi:hypothetical protein